MSNIEEAILRHGARGMDVLKEYMPENFCELATKALYELNRGTILLATGFYVAGFTETDGPLGTLTLALALKKLGFNSVIVTDTYSKDCFEKYGVETVYVPLDADNDYLSNLFESYSPVGLVSIERCGKNIRGKYENMRGVDIGEYTAPVDELFIIAKEKNIPTWGVGDGGNEIGMGNLKDIITDKLSLTPCRVEVDYLVIATVSNWGAYGITGYLEKFSGEQLKPEFDWAKEYLAFTSELGSLDGVNKTKTITVDGLPIEYEEEAWNLR